MMKKLKFFAISRIRRATAQQMSYSLRKELTQFYPTKLLDEFDNLSNREEKVNIKNQKNNVKLKNKTFRFSIKNNKIRIK